MKQILQINHKVEFGFPQILFCIGILYLRFFDYVVYLDVGHIFFCKDVVFRVDHGKNCRWPHQVMFFSTRYFFELLSIVLFAYVCPVVVECKVSSTHRFFSSSLNRISRLIDATLYLLLFSGIVDTKTFRFKLTSNSIRRFAGFVRVIFEPTEVFRDF